MSWCEQMYMELVRPQIPCQAGPLQIFQALVSKRDIRKESLHSYPVPLDILNIESEFLRTDAFAAAYLAFAVAFAFL